MQERRKKRRFSLRLPCLITLAGSNREQEAYQMETQNISSSGIYIRTVAPLPVGEYVDVDVMVTLPEASPQTTEGSCVSLSGEVLRTESDGMAVAFNRPYRITGIQKLISLNRTRTRWMEMMAQKARMVAAPVIRQHKVGHTGAVGPYLKTGRRDPGGPHLAPVK